MSKSMKFVNSYLKEYLTKISFIVVFCSSRDKLQEYVMKNRKFYFKNLIWPSNNLEDQVQDRIEGHHPMSLYKPNNFCKDYF